MRLALDNATPTDIKRLDELLQILCDTVKVTDATEADLLIGDPDPNCALVKELKKIRRETYGRIDCKTAANTK